MILLLDVAAPQRTPRQLKMSDDDIGKRQASGRPLIVLGAVYFLSFPFLLTLYTYLG